MSLMPTFTVNCEHLKIKNNLCVRFPYMQCNNKSHKAAYINTQKHSIKISFYFHVNVQIKHIIFQWINNG